MAESCAAAHGQGTSRRSTAPIPPAHRAAGVEIAAADGYVGVPSASPGRAFAEGRGSDSGACGADSGRCPLVAAAAASLGRSA